MAKHWIKDDMIRNKSNLNKLISNGDSNSRLCWLYMENQKYYISDLETKLLASLNKNKISIKLTNNSNLGVQITLKKYLYSSMVNLESTKYVFIFINELEVKNSEFVDLKKLMPNPSLIMNGDNLIVHAEMNKKNKNTDESVEDQITQKDSETNLSNLINSMTPASSLKNCTLEIIEENLHLNKPNEVTINLNDAFNKNSDLDPSHPNQNNITEDKDSLLSTDNSENIIKSSNLEANSNMNSNSISEIQNENQTRSTSSIKIVSLDKLRRQEQQQLEVPNSGEEINNDLNLCSRTSRCSSVDYMSDCVSVSSLNATFKRKRKLLQSKVSDQFENDSINKDDYGNTSPRSDFLVQTKNERRLSSSSTSTSNSSSSSSSLCDSTSSLNNIQSKPSIFAPKRLVHQHFQKSFSEQKKVAKSRVIHNLFSPVSKKKLRLNNLFESSTTTTTKPNTNTNQISSTNDTSDSTNRNVLDKYKSLNLAESQKKTRRKLIGFDPLSHVMDEDSFDNSNLDRDSVKKQSLPNKLVIQDTIMLSKANSPYRSQSTEKTPNNTSIANNESIPAGQKPYLNHANSTTASNLLELSKSSLNTRQESLMSFRYKLEPNELQSYIKNHVIAHNFD